ncbi:hypothetical protein [Brevundimonas sp.]|jgi:hypothetical protein|uniref:hypothetical protein n=1 Tax=Brevundimonas TaxID=41275 RepID=UPI0002A292D8|nr:hypothetical protein [Brevundimonas sp.]EKY29764.1 hypothetical protein HMPREF0185_01104 [Brevundimonas diminuta 470-4]MBN9464149.1 hypothetical protein [Brevundimonas sp.]
MTEISETSTRRFQALIATVSEVAKTVRADSRVALADRSSPTVVHRLDLDTGTLSGGEATYDVVILDSESSRRLSTAEVADLLQRLSAEGVIAIRLRPSLTRALRKLFRRRRDDVGQDPFLRGLPRSGAALLASRLYVRELKVRDHHKQVESWVIGSPAPLGDTRYRDQIGRVATDYLRAVGPIIAGAHIPNI